MLRVQGKELDLRVSTVPTAHGESVVMRLLDRETVVFDFKRWASPTNSCRSSSKVLEQPHGILLVTGPTGSGKTTTLYTALSKLNTPDVKIITVEDPVEYQIEGINQIQVKPQIGLDFAHALRSHRAPGPGHHHDRRNPRPGDRAHRDPVRAHRPPGAVDAAHQQRAGGITRLLDMGVEDYLLTSTVNGILAQRLVRRLEPTHARALRGAAGGDREVRPAPLPAARATIYLYRPKPSALAPTGYLGRTTIMEFLVMNDELRRAGDAPRRHGRDRAARARRPACARCTRTASSRRCRASPRSRKSCASPRTHKSACPCSATRRCNARGELLDGQMEAASDAEVIVAPAGAGASAGRGAAAPAKAAASRRGARCSSPSPSPANGWCSSPSNWRRCSAPASRSIAR